MTEYGLKNLRYFEYLRSVRELSSKLGRDPTNREISQKMGISIGEVEQRKITFKVTGGFEELDESVKLSVESPERSFFQKEHLWEIRHLLGEKDFRLLMARYEMEDENWKNLFQKSYPDKINSNDHNRWRKKVLTTIEQYIENTDS